MWGSVREGEERGAGGVGKCGKVCGVQGKVRGDVG